MKPEGDFQEHELPDHADTADGDEPAEVPCPFCGEMISEEAQRCPECGDFGRGFNSPRLHQILDNYRCPVRS